MATVRVIRSLTEQMLAGGVREARGGLWFYLCPR